MKNKTNSEKLLSYYQQQLPISPMALAYLFEKGTTTVLSISKDEYTKQVEEAIKEAKSEGGMYFMSLNVAVKLLEIAKELARFSIFDIITALRNQTSGKTSLRQYIDEEVPYRLVEVLGIPEEDVDEDTVFICADALEEDSDVMFNYDAIDGFLRDRLKELGVTTGEDEDGPDDIK